ncbi:MAG: hypothetical protein IPM24_27570 [Bryobacterales bacterium]|nr:hypothetical protein [Bryobacterales bacterium]
MLRQTTGALAVPLLAILGSPLLAQSVCSTQSVVGVWAASSHGVVFSPASPVPLAVPGAAVGLVSIGYDSRVSLKLSGNLGGQFAVVAATGTIVVNPDCTGTFSATVPGMTGFWNLQEQIVVLDNGNEVQTISTGQMFRRPAVWQCRWKRLSHTPLLAAGQLPACQAEMIRGTWTGASDGVRPAPGADPSAPAAFLTRGVIDYRQELNGTFTASIGGTIVNGEYTGSILELSPDCTGKWTYTLKADDGTELPGSGVEYFVVVDHGREIWGLPVQGVLGVPVGLVRYRRLSPVAFQ